MMENYEFEDYLDRKRKRKTHEEVMSERDPLAIRFGTNLSTLRKINNENNNHLAEIWNLSKTTISLFEYGMRIPNIATMEVISKYYDITIDMLIHSEPSELRRFIEKRRTPNPIARLIKRMHSLE